MLGHKSHSPGSKENITHHYIVQTHKNLFVQTRCTQQYTFGVVSGVKLKQFDGVVRETVHVDSVLQDNNDPGEEIITIMIIIIVMLKLL